MLSRIKERYQATGDTARRSRRACREREDDLERRADRSPCSPIFAGTGVPQIKEIGVGLAVAIALDATVVRLVLVPTTMELIGEPNWWLPKCLDRRLPDIDFESSPTRSRKRL